MVNQEHPAIALYQHQSTDALRHGDSGPWHLVKVQLLHTNIQDGIHTKSDIQIVGLASHVPAYFESGHLMLDQSAETIRTIKDIQSSLFIPVEDIVHALENNMIVVYTYAEME